MTLEGKHILIISNEPWGDVWYSKHNYAWELSRLNKVIFVNPPKPWRGGRSNVTINKINDRLSVLEYSNCLPIKNILLFKKNNKMISKRIQKSLARIGFTDFIYWSFDPFRLYNPRLLGASYSIFHAVDKYQFKHFGEQFIYSNCDVHLYVSPVIQNEFIKFNKPGLVVPHSLSIDEFEADQSYETGLPEGINAIYAGNIDSRVDSDVIEQLAKQFPQVNYVFIGNIIRNNPSESFKRIFVNKEQKNIVTIGPKPFKELKNYIHKSNLCIAFMNAGINGNRIAHHKILQYLAMGKPVFSSVFSDYQSISSLLHMSDDLNTQIKWMNDFLENGEADNIKEDRKLYAKKHSYTSTLKNINEFINQTKQQ